MDEGLLCVGPYHNRLNHSTIHGKVAVIPWKKVVICDNIPGLGILQSMQAWLMESYTRKCLTKVSLWCPATKSSVFSDISCVFFRVLRLTDDDKVHCV